MCLELSGVPTSRTIGVRHVDVAAFVKGLICRRPEPAYFSPEHAEVYAQCIPVEGRFGTDQEDGAYAPRSGRTPRLELHAIASLIFDAIGNLQITMNKEIEELYELVDK